MRLKAWLVLFAVSAAVVAVAASDGTKKLPSRLAGYRSWTMTAKPRTVPREMAMACAPPSAFGDLEERYGPHAERWIRVYANATAASAMKEPKRIAYPAGSIIVKEKLVSPEDAAPEGVAFMIKHEKGKFTDSGGWEFLYYPSGPAAAKVAEYKGCTTCHRAGAKRDYVFGTFEDEEEE